MKLALFDTIDETIDLLGKHKEEYKSICKELKYTLLTILEDENIIDITTRIKTANSLREKIIRNQYYLSCDSPQAILNNLSDLIGLKIDCRFMEEEFNIYTHLKEAFNVPLEDGYFACENYEHIALELASHQPQTQKNGFYIYRIDGYYQNANNRVDFELQIKSLVNTFWGDIEHKLVYKNTNYVFYDDFMQDMLGSIKANLTIIDRQLLAINNAMENNSNISESFMDTISFEDLISKAINDLCAEKLTNSIGFPVNIKDTSNMLGHYIFKKNIQNSNDESQIRGLLKLFNRLSNEFIDFENAIEMDLSINSKDMFVKTLGEYLLGVMNLDYDWFVFFRILFAMEPGNNNQDFLLFLNVYKSNIVNDEVFNKCFDKVEEHEQIEIKNELLKMYAEILGEVGDIKIVHNKRIDDLKEVFCKFLEELNDRVISMSDFKHYTEAYKEELRESILHVFK